MQDFFLFSRAAHLGFVTMKGKNLISLTFFFALNNKLKVLKDKKYEIFNYGSWFGFTI